MREVAANREPLKIFMSFLGLHKYQRKLDSIGCKDVIHISPTSRNT